MDVSTLKAKIQSKEVPNYLLFSGEEWKVQEIYIGQVSKIMNKPLRYIDSITDVYNQIRNKSFAGNSYVYVVRDDKELMQNEKLQDQIDAGILADNILIHLITNIDKRTKFYKRYISDIIVFEQLSDALLKKYIAKEIKLSERNIMRLIEICESDYGRILLEIDKIKSYAKGFAGDYGYDNYFQMLLADGVIYIPAYDAIFDLVDSILNRKVNQSFDLLQQSYEVGEATLVILSVLYNETRALVQLQSCRDKDVSRITGLTGWQIKKAKSHVGKYSIEELIYILRLVQKIESGIKTGKIEDEFAMSYLLTHIL